MIVKVQCSIRDCRTVAVGETAIPLCVGHRDAIMDDLAIHLARRTLIASRKPQDAPTDWIAPAEDESKIESFVYFIRRERLIKIGYSTSPAARAVNLGGIVLATISGNFRDEKAMHRQFAHHRQQGEWFDPGEDLIGYINCLRTRDGLPDITA